MEFLGLNIFGVSSIQEAVFVNNTPNCVIAFLDSYSPVETADLYITDSFFLFGTRGGGDYAFNKFAGGLNIIATINRYQVKSYCEKHHSVWQYWKHVWQYSSQD